MSEASRRAVLAGLAGLPIAAGIGWFVFGTSTEAFGKSEGLGWKPFSEGGIARAAIAFDAIDRLAGSRDLGIVHPQSFDALPFGAVTGLDGDARGFLEKALSRGREPALQALATGFVIHEEVERVLSAAPGSPAERDAVVTARLLGESGASETAIRMGLERASHRAAMAIHTLVPIGEPVSWMRALMAWERRRQRTLSGLAGQVAGGTRQGALPLAVYEAAVGRAEAVILAVGGILEERGPARWVSTRLTAAPGRS
jgi:hypothetical protein